jgi:GTP-binding protein Era
MTEGKTRCGFVAVLGAPNAGKSTLVNRAVGQKVSIVSPKVQTTRSRVLGIVTEGATQIVLIDTPGIFAPRRRLDRAMVAAAWGGAADADAIVLIVDAARKALDDETRNIVAGLKQQNRRAILVLNKIDIVKREKLLALTAALNAEGVFTDTFMISAETGDGVDDLLRALAQRMPEGPHHFPEDQVTDAPMRSLAAEITREQLFPSCSRSCPMRSPSRRIPGRSSTTAAPRSSRPSSSRGTARRRSSWGRAAPASRGCARRPSASSKPRWSARSIFSSS